jgi:hypothetical protein
VVVEVQLIRVELQEQEVQAAVELEQLEVLV